MEKEPEDIWSKYPEPPKRGLPMWMPIVSVTVAVLFMLPKLGRWLQEMAWASAQ